MKQEYQIIIDLVKSAITGEKVTVPENIDWQPILKIAKAHQITPMIYYGLQNSGIETPYDEMLFNKVATAGAVEIQQLSALEQIEQAFNKNSIDYAVLKGCKLKYLYPKTEMRIMSDLDLLIKPEQYDKIKPTMEKLGFFEEGEYDYEHHWRKGFVHIELHKSLMPTSDSNADLYEYFGTGWQKFTTRDTFENRYSMTREDELIFILGHLTKHYRFSGIGIRHFTDIYVYKSHHRDIDETYLITQLKKLGLFEFYKNVIFTTKNWFDNAKSTDATEIITKRVFESGANGTNKNYTVSNAAFSLQQEGSISKVRSKTILQSIFAPLSRMETRYPVLNKAPVLLPIMWAVRWISILFNPKVIKTRSREIGQINDKVVADYSAELEKVGLKYELK